MVAQKVVSLSKMHVASHDVRRGHDKKTYDDRIGAFTPTLNMRVLWLTWVVAGKQIGCHLFAGRSAVV